MRIRAIPLYLVGFIAIVVSSLSFAILPTPELLLYIVIVCPNIGLIISLIGVNKAHKLMANLNDSFSAGYLAAIESHLQKILVTNN